MKASHARKIGPMLSLCLSAALGSASLACSDDNGEGPIDSSLTTIRIGALADQTGPSRSTSYESAMGLAVTHMNRALEQADSNIRFEVLIADSRSDPPTAQAAAVDLINNEGVVGMVTDVSADTTLVNQLNYDSATPASYKVPITCYACSSAFFNDPNGTNADPVRQAAERDLDNWLYRVFFNGKYEAYVSVRIMLHKASNGDVNGDGNFKVTVYAQNDPFGQSSSQSIRTAVEELAADQPHSVEIISIPGNTDPASDFSDDLQRLVDTRNESMDDAVDGAPDAIFLALLPQLATAVVNAYSGSGYDVPMQAATAFRRNYILRAIGDLAVGLEGDSPRVYAADESGEAFADAYQEETNNIPEMLSAHSYDCAMTLMLATLKAAHSLEDPSQVDPTAIRDQMLSVTAADGELVRSTEAGLAQAATLILSGSPINYAGASGVGPWDAVGDTFPELVHWSVVNDGQLRFRDEEAYECSPEHPTCQLSSE